MGYGFVYGVIRRYGYKAMNKPSDLLSGAILDEQTERAVGRAKMVSGKRTTTFKKNSPSNMAAFQRKFVEKIQKRLLCRLQYNNFVRKGQLNKVELTD